MAYSKSKYRVTVLQRINWYFLAWLVAHYWQIINPDYSVCIETYDV